MRTPRDLSTLPQLTPITPERREFIEAAAPPVVAPPRERWGSRAERAELWVDRLAELPGALAKVVPRLEALAETIEKAED
jgi:hypothetical protein